VTELPNPALLAALMLLAAIVGGYAAAFCHVPRVVGYLLAGVALHYALRWYRGDWSAPPDLHSVEGSVVFLTGIRTVALGLIMFSIGNVFEAKHFHAVGRAVLRITLSKLSAVLLLVTTGCAAAALLQGVFQPGVAIALGVLLGVTGLATAPAATLLVLREYEAKGPNSDAILTLTAINNIACIILFHVAFMLLSGLGWIESSYSTGRWIWLDLLLTSLGSVALGVVIGFLFSIVYVKITIADFLLLFLGVIVVLGVFQEALARELHLSYSFLLTCLFIGATFTNITPGSAPFYDALKTFANPIFALFFVLAGYQLHLEELAHLGWLGMAYVALRIAGKAGGGWLGVRWNHSDDYVPTIGFGMLCQAGVAIGLAAFVDTTWGTVVNGQFVPHAGAGAFHTVIVGSVVVFELLGPIALKQVAVRSGEVKAVTLLRRRRTPSYTPESVWHQALEALRNAVRPTSQAALKPTEPLQVRHIMRSNVKVLPASARLDDVLRFVESSRFNHFPVVGDDGGYLGMIHYADLRNILYVPGLRNLVTATDLARGDTPTAHRDTPLQELFDKFHDSDVGSIPVLETPPSRRVIGMVEQRDLLLAVRTHEQPDEHEPDPTGGH
jgi:Kef-type K+ transport system membrane component KefB/predicted transcriptional regulator